MARKRTSQEEWRKRIERWKDSGLTAEQFAAEMGINAGTLQFWQYKLKRGVGSPGRRHAGTRSDAILSSLVEVRAPMSATVDTRFEIELGNGRRLRVPSNFEVDALRTMLAVLEGVS
jgi:hypothetical protein